MYAVVVVVVVDGIEILKNIAVFIAASRLAILKTSPVVLYRVQNKNVLI